MGRKPNPCKPRLVVISVAFEGEEPVPRCYAAPDDGRPVEDLTLAELRPWPAMDAQLALARAMDKAAPPAAKEEGNG